MPRRLYPDESALWKKVAATVKPLAKAKAPLAPAAPPTVKPPKPAQRNIAAPAAAPRPATKLPPPRRPHQAATLDGHWRSEEHTSALQSLMRISYAVCSLQTHKISK